MKKYWEILYYFTAEFLVLHTTSTVSNQ